MIERRATGRTALVIVVLVACAAGRRGEVGARGGLAEAARRCGTGEISWRLTVAVLPIASIVNYGLHMPVLLAHDDPLPWVDCGLAGRGPAKVVAHGWRVAAGLVMLVVLQG